MITPTHLYASDGRWIAWYHPRLPYVWSVRNRWIGWFAWPTDAQLARDVLDPAGHYLGTRVGDRLLAKVYRAPVPVPDRVPEPTRPVGAPDVAHARELTPPPGFVDVPLERLGP